MTDDRRQGNEEMKKASRFFSESARLRDVFRKNLRIINYRGLDSSLLIRPDVAPHDLPLHLPSQSTWF